MAKLLANGLSKDLPDADVHRLRDLPGLQDNPVRPYHLQRALCDAERHAEA